MGLVDDPAACQLIRSEHGGRDPVRRFPVMPPADASYRTEIPQPALLIDGSKPVREARPHRLFDSGIGAFFRVLAR